MGLCCEDGIDTMRVSKSLNESESFQLSNHPTGKNLIFYPPKDYLINVMKFAFDANILEEVLILDENENTYSPLPVFWTFRFTNNNDAPPRDTYKGIPRQKYNLLPFDEIVLFTYGFGNFFGLDRM